VRAFFSAAAVGKESRSWSAGNLADRFTGATPNYDLSSPSAKRLLQLSSVRFLIMQPLESATLIPAFVESSKSAMKPGEVPLAETVWTINGITKRVLFQHPPSSPKTIITHIEPGRTDLLFSIALQPSGYGGPCGDGVDFQVDVRAGNGAVSRMFHHFINPYGNPADRKWFDERLNLSSYMNQNVAIALSTGPGPKGDSCMDWSGWGDLSFEQPELKVAYRNEVSIYEYSSVLPRAAVFYRAELTPGDDSVLSRLVDPNFNIFERCLVKSSDLTFDVRSELDALNSGAPGQATPATIVSERSDEVEIEAFADRRALLVLNDTDYPGWCAYVDGQKMRVLNVDYLFRGVLIAAGRHRVVFRYEPKSFRFGGGLSALALMGLALTVRYHERLPFR
jgi:hypothetical protein